MSFAKILKQIPDGWRLQRIENRETIRFKSYWTVKLQCTTWPYSVRYGRDYVMEEALAEAIILVLQAEEAGYGTKR